MYQPLPFCQLLDKLAVRIVEIQMVVAVFLALVDKLSMIPRQEQDGLLRLHIFGMRFFDKRGHQFAGLAVVSAKFCMILVTVQLYEIKTLSVGCPTDIGEITVGRIAGIQVNGFLIPAAKVRRYFNSKNEFPLLIIFMKSTFYNVTLMQY